MSIVSHSIVEINIIKNEQYNVPREIIEENARHDTLGELFENRVPSDTPSCPFLLILDFRGGIKYKLLTL